MNRSKRIFWLDYARAIAIIFVVLCHAVEGSYYFVRMGEIEVPFFVWLTENVMFTFGRFGVPLFVMISGALMLNREYDIAIFYKKSLFPLFVTTEIWIIICYFFDLFLKGCELSIKDILYSIVFIKNSPLSHMWYMPMILGIYLMIPFIARAIQKVSFKDVALPLLVAFLAFSFTPLFNAFSTEVVGFLSDAKLTLDVGFMGGIYGMMLILGHYISNENILKRISSKLIILVFLVSFICNSVGARFFYVQKLTHSDVFGWYTSPFIIICSVCLFELFRRNFQKSCSKVIGFLSKVSFSIYLIHNLVLYAFNKLVSSGIIIVKDDSFLWVIKLFLSLFISFFVAWVLDKIPLPKLKKYVCHMK